MIKDFLIINITGNKDSIDLRLNNKFFTKEIQRNTKNSETLVNKILVFLNNNKAVVDVNFSIIINLGPGSFSAIRTALSIAKGIRLSKGANIYGYKDTQLLEFKLKNIEILIKGILIENKLIKPIYLS